MTDILQTIIANKKDEIKLVPRYRRADDVAPHRHVSMRAALEGSDSGIIAEFKRRSPSKGWIHRDANPAPVARAYQRAGATAMSVLTDEKFFGGTLGDFLMVRAAVDLPLLRKDFIIDPCQIEEAAEIGADAVLLIAAALSQSQCRELADCAHRHGLETLLEIHSADELAYATPDIDMIGVNNRHLGSFVTDVACSYGIASALPAGRCLVSESGISEPQTVKELRERGFRGFLIGETFMKDDLPGQALARFISALQP